MTKQEEIREGIHDIIGDCMIKLGCGEGGCPRAEAQAEEAQETAIDELISYLHSQGLVIKDRRYGMGMDTRDGYNWKDTFFVIPLIKE